MPIRRTYPPLLQNPCHLLSYYDCFFSVVLKNSFIVNPNIKPDIVQSTIPIIIVFVFISLPSHNGNIIDIIINIDTPQLNPVLIQLF